MNANQVNDFLLAGIQSDKLSSGYSAELMNASDISSLYSAGQKHKITVPSVPIVNKFIFINVLSWYSYLNICAISVPQLYLLKRESQPERNLSLSGGYMDIFGHLNNPLRSSHTANMQSGHRLTASIISGQLPDGMGKEKKSFGDSLSTEDSGMRKEKDSNCVSLPIWAFNAHLNGGEVDDFTGVTTPVNEDFSYITMRKDFSYITTRGNSHYKNSHYYFFTLSSNIGYIDDAPAKSGVRRENLNTRMATVDAECVFFYVVDNAYLMAAYAYPNSMVALSEHPKGWLVSIRASILTSDNVTAPIERENSGGDCFNHRMEIVAMMTIPTQTYFKFLFLSIKRSDTTAKPFRIAATAPDEHSARMMLVGDYILLFAGRIPVQVVAA
ncbi:host cell division inhibitor Icd-like protein [Xenorhabdus ehlersii]|uniref:Ash family protein n=1 Tax=Xenorhabdus ehlersii TaxID=290111 RepID=A0A2D0INJ3_9GAMM|nr:host cell division inhibitor Icd-like protein [Xenorhabdus ehlersii]PHM23361.1 bacteriophage protein [Xenorhabdus ehlersii]RKE93374.1 Ash family protein [Xenorhabdus ehlersii]